MQALCADIARLKTHIAGGSDRSFGPMHWLMLAISPSLHVVFVYRLGQWAATQPRPISWAAYAAYAILYYLVVRILWRCEISRTAKIGPGFLVPHADGIIIAPHAEMGQNVTIFHGVTIAGKGAYPHNAAVLGDGVIVYPGAKIVGNVRIGTGAKIGPNSVIFKDIPEHSTAVAPEFNLIKWGQS